MHPPRRRSRSAAAEAAVRQRLAAIGAELGRAAPAGQARADPNGTAQDVEVGPGADPQPEASDGPAPGREWVARADPGPRGTVVLCVVAVAAATLAAGVTWLSRPSVEPVPSAPVVVAGSPAPTADPSTSTAADIVIAVVGQVVTPGLVTLPSGSRVADALAAAGGALPGADLAGINLARVLSDGEQVAVGVPGATDGGGAAPSGASTGLVDLNAASEQELESLPGVGPVLAGRIVQWRTDNGGFGSVEELQEVDGIGPATFEELRDEVTV